METNESTTKVDETQVVENAETVAETTKTNDEEVKKTDATELEPSVTEKPTQNGDVEPEIVENGDNNEKVEEVAKESEEKTQAEDTTDTTEATKEVPDEEAKSKPEERHARATRGAKRKANDSEGTNDAVSSETVEQKENVNSKSNDNVPTENDLRDDPSLKSLSASNIMGKGKRARIPNKRYSDILMSPNRKSVGHQKPFDVTEPEVSIKVKEEPLDSVPSGVSSPSLPKKSRNVLTKENLQDPKFLKPFKYGWKRELVWRSTSTQSKRMGDIYYYTPSGKKVRSFREVSDHLNNKNLSLDNFSFVKEALGIDDPEKEIVRDAKIKSSDSFTDSPAPPAKKLEIKKPVKKLHSPKSSGSDTPKAETPVVATATPGRKRAAAAGVTTVVEKEKEVAKETPPSSTKKILKMPLKKGKGPLAKKPKLSLKSDEPMEVETTPVRSSPSKTSKPCQPCSIRCEGVQGIIPTLQCRVCLCLYHHECVGMSHDLIYPYVCKNCQDQGQEPGDQSPSSIASPPPLTPINTLKSVAATLNTTLPKLQRIPRPDLSDPLPVLPPLQAIPPLLDINRPAARSDLLPPLTPKPPHLLQQESVGDSCKSLVGSVTSWLPHNARIVDNQGATETPRPQYLEYIAGRKYLVIPKHNFMSVSSNTSSTCQAEDSIVTPLQPSEVPITSASLGPSVSTVGVAEGGEECAEIKKEPLSPARAEEPVAVEVLGEVVETKREHDAVAGPLEVQDSLIEGEDESGQTPQTSAQKQPQKKRNLKLRSITNANPTSPGEKNETKFMENYLQNLSFGYNTLLYVFQYLKVQDLLRAGCVCTMWRDIGSHPILWRTVRMKNSQVHSFEGLANTLKKHGTVHLDLRKMLLPSTGDEIWPEFSKTISRVDTLRKIELCRCPASVVEQLANSNPDLQVINAVTIKCDSMNLDPFSAFTCIKELRLKSTSGLNINSIDSLKELKSLRMLSLTSVNDLHKLDLTVIANLTRLESLDLGECTDFPKNFGQDILAKLEKLEKLRLEKGQGNCHTFELLEAVKEMKCLEQLELVNFDVKAGFDKALGSCVNLKKLMIIPTYISQSATTNNMVLSGVLRLQDNLTHFVWGVTLELLRVTELFVDQCEDSNKKEKRPTGNGDSIPVLKPVPDLSNGGAIQAASNPPQVEILPLPNLQKLLLNSLPTTRVKILKIPFHATWRQTLTDSV